MKTSEQGYQGKANYFYNSTSALIVQSHDDREVGALRVNGPHSTFTQQMVSYSVDVDRDLFSFTNTSAVIESGDQQTGRWMDRQTDATKYIISLLHTV